MDDLRKIKKRINKENAPVRERRLLRFFNGALALLLIGIGCLIYCKEDEDGKLLKKWFNIDVSFRDMNEKIQGTLNQIFYFKDASAGEQSVAGLDLYHSLGNNNYSTDDGSVRALRDGNVIASSYQNEKKYFVAIEYDNRVRALYTMISECALKSGDSLKKNDVIGTYDGEYFNCIFKKDEKTISYGDVL